MFCINCGTQLSDDSRFCSNCGSVVQSANPAIEAPAQKLSEGISVTSAVSEAPVAEASDENKSDNPYARVVNPVAQQAYQPQTCENIYQQPSVAMPQSPVYDNSTPINSNNQPYYTPQASYPTYQQPAQNFPNTPVPQYMRPMQTHGAVQYVAVSPVVHTRPEPKSNPFTFISAGIMGLMILFLFLPWFMVDNSGYNILTMLTESDYLSLYDADIFVLCSLLMLVALGMLIPGFILAFTKKNRMPIGFAVAASVLTFISLFFFLILSTEVSSAVSVTPVPIVMFLLAVANIVFPAIARKK